MNTQHTALPWRQKTECFITAKLLIESSNGLNVATIFDTEYDIAQGDDDLANAEFILRACNNFYPLLEALKRLDAFIPDREGLQPVDAEVRAFMEHEGIWRAKELARDAIERAKSPG